MTHVVLAGLLAALPVTGAAPAPAGWGLVRSLGLSPGGTASGPGDVLRAEATPSPEALPGATEETRREAQALAETMHATGQMQAVLMAMRGQMADTIAGNSGKPRAEVAAIVDEVLMPELRAQLPAFGAVLVEIWAANFTAEELRGLAAFYATPLGRKLLERQPLLFQQSFAAGQAWGREAARNALRKHADELRGRGLKI